MKAAGLTSIGGSKNRENQDVFFIKDRTIGVFDGHGRHGLAAATTAATHFAAAAAAVDAVTFESADAAVCTAMPDWENSGVVGGTTATMVVAAEDGTLTVAHVGDSEVWVFDEGKESRQLTVDHSPLNLEEYKRVQATSLQPTEFRFVPADSRTKGRPVFVADKDGNWVPNPAGGHFFCDVRGSWAANISGNGVNLALTRALGDVELKPYGLSAVPSIIVEPPAPGRVLVVASDGLWDVLTPTEVQAIVRRDDRDPEAAATALMAAAEEAGTRFFGTDYDNITLVVAYV